MERILYGAPRLTERQRQQLTEKALGLCVERNLNMQIMSKCVIAQNYRELWVLVPDHQRGFRLI